MNITKNYLMIMYENGDRVIWKKGKKEDYYRLFKCLKGLKKDFVDVIMVKDALVDWRDVKFVQADDLGELNELAFLEIL